MLLLLTPTLAHGQDVVPTTPVDSLVDGVSTPWRPFSGETPTDVLDFCVDYHPSPIAARLDCQRLNWTAFSGLESAAADLEVQRIIARRLGLLAVQGERAVTLDPESIDDLADALGGGGDGPPTGVTVSLSESSIESLSEAIASALPSGSGEPGDLGSDELIGTLAGLLVGLWVMTRIYRLVVPGG